MLTDEDLEAEQIFINSILRLIDYDTARRSCKDLERRDRTAAAYLKLLLTNRKLFESNFRTTL